MSDDIIPPGEISGVIRKRLDRNLQFLCDGWRAIGRLEGRRMSEWIKCSKQTMPDAALDAVAVVCRIGEQRSVSLGRWSKHKKAWLNVNYQPMPDWFVTHWQPLPEPPHD